MKGIIYTADLPELPAESQRWNVAQWIDSNPGDVEKWEHVQDLEPGGAEWKRLTGGDRRTWRVLAFAHAHATGESSKGLASIMRAFADQERGIVCLAPYLYAPPKTIRYAAHCFEAGGSWAATRRAVEAPRARAIDGPDLGKLLRMLDDGWSMRAAAAHFGVTHRTVRLTVERARKAGIAR